MVFVVSPLRQAYIVQYSLVFSPHDTRCFANKTSLFKRRIIHFLCKCLSTNLVMAQKGHPHHIFLRQALTVATLLSCAQLQGLVYLQEPVALQAHQNIRESDDEA